MGLLDKLLTKGGRSRKNRKSRSKRNSRRRRTLRGGGGDSRAGAQLESRRN